MSKLLLLLLLVCLTQAATYRPKMRNDTRSWSNIFQSGFIEGALKYNDYGKMDCTLEGMKLTRSLLTMINSRILNTPSGRNATLDDVKNAMMLFGDIMHICNYFTTVEGLVVMQQVREKISDFLPP